jgi:hypothetical protein
MKHHVYIASRYSHPDPAVRAANVRASVEAAAEIIRRGHHAYSPLAMTDPIAQLAPEIDYETWMALDASIITRWATALLYLSPSRGADRELRMAQRAGIFIFNDLAEIPDRRPAVESRSS